MSDGKQEERNCQSIRETLIGVLGIIAIFLTFTLPLKFGVISGLPEAPTSFLSSMDLKEFIRELIYIFWPVMLFPILSSLLLLGVLIFSPPPEENPDSRLLIPLSWVLLFLSVLPGFINASTLDFPIIQTATISGYAAFAIAIYRLIELRPDLKIWLINAVAISTVITVMIGVSQYFFGFRETIEYLYNQEIKTGVKVSSLMRSRLHQVRVYSTFSICNSLAAHIILTLPVIIWGLLYSRIIIKSVITTLALSLLVILSPPVTNQPMFFIVAFIVFSVIGFSVFKFPEKKQLMMSWITIAPVIGIILWIFYLTQSRGGIIGLGTAFIFLIFIIPIRKSFKLLTVCMILAAITSLLFFDIAGRKFSSLEVRLDYCLSSLEMFLNHPFAGTGWGDFFHEYTKIKQHLNTEAPHNPHNFIMSFTGQAGIAGLLASVFVFFLPFFIFFRKIKGLNSAIEKAEPDMRNETKKAKWLSIFIITGWCAWAVHSLADFNIQIQGTVATAIVLLLIMNSVKSSENVDESFSNRGEKLYLVYWYGCVPLILLICMSVSIHQFKFDNSLLRFKEACGMDVTSKGKHIPLSDTQLEDLLNKCSKTAEYSAVPWIIASYYAEMHHRNWVRVELYCKEAIKRSPERASIYYHLAVAQNQLGKKQESLKNLKTAAEMFPESYGELYKKAVEKK